MNHNCETEEFIVLGFSDEEGNFNKEAFERELIERLKGENSVKEKEPHDGTMLKKKRRVVSSSKENGKSTIEEEKYKKVQYSTNNRVLQDAFVKKIKSIKEYNYCNNLGSKLMVKQKIHSLLYMIQKQSQTQLRRSSI